MQLGIDFGTTRTVVACRDRGNYPVLSFLDEDDNPVEWYPSVVAERRGELRFGFAALATANDPDWTVLRSFKRLLAGRGKAHDFSIELGDTTLPGGELITRFLASLRTAILTRSNRPKRAAKDSELVAVVATPATAHGAQRFVTLDAFRHAGFEVTGMLNEPSAAGFEYSHRYRDTITSRREHIVVYDLGGGTFDASLVRMTGRDHEAVATAGSSQLGGDDFDDLLVDMVLKKARIARGGLTRRALYALADHCREAKERIDANTKRVVIDLPSCIPGHPRAAETTIAVSDYFDRCVPLVEKTLEVMAPVMARLEENSDDPLAELAGVYVVGGASALPVVGRVLREKFGRRVHRSAYPSGAIAIGLAIAGDTGSGFKLKDRLSRHFGVFRESDGGKGVVFDPIFSREAEVPLGHGAPVVERRVYRSAHNVGRYRFVECASLDASGVPLGDITAYSDVLFPFDREVRDRKDLGAVPVERTASEGPLIEEAYTVTRHGLVRVTITDLESGFARAFDVGA